MIEFTVNMFKSSPVTYLLDGNNLDSIPLYNHIIEFKITNDYLKFNKLPDKLPTSLAKLVVKSSNLEKLPETLPYTLTHINIEDNRVTQLPWIPISIKYFNAKRNNIDHLGIYADTRRLFTNIYKLYLDNVENETDAGYDIAEFDAVNLDINPITDFYLNTEHLLRDWQIQSR